jgi:Carboxylesterase family
MFGNGIGWQVRFRLAAGVVALCALLTGATLTGVTLAGATAAGASAAPAGHHGADDGLVVATADGRVRGTTAGAIDEFLGIPYAAPPVGRLRWRPPHQAAHWEGIRQAMQFAPHCPQPATPFGAASMSEDCLYLNVYTPPAGTAAAGTAPAGTHPTGTPPTDAFPAGTAPISSRGHHDERGRPVMV